MKKLTNIDLLALPNLDTPDASFVTFGAKTDGLYQKIGTVESKLSIEGHLHTGIYEPVFDKNTAFNKNFGNIAGTVSEGNHTHTFASLTSKPTTLAGYGITDAANISHSHAGVYEPAFTKNTAFNKNFGTSAGTVSEGNHTHTFVSITSKPTTISGYGIGDAYTKTEIDNKFAAIKKEIVFTKTGFNGYVYPSVFPADRGYTISGYRLGSNAQDFSVTINSINYTKDNIVGAVLGQGIELILNDVTIETGYTVGNVILTLL